MIEDQKLIDQMVNAIKNKSDDKLGSPKLEKVTKIAKIVEEEVDENVFDARELLLNDDLEPVEEKLQKFKKKQETEDDNRYRKYMSWMPQEPQSVQEEEEKT